VLKWLVGLKVFLGVIQMDDEFRDVVSEVFDFKEFLEKQDALRIRVKNNILAVTDVEGKTIIPVSKPSLIISDNTCRFIGEVRRFRKNFDDLNSRVLKDLDERFAFDDEKEYGAIVQNFNIDMFDDKTAFILEEDGHGCVSASMAIRDPFIDVIVPKKDLEITITDRIKVR
jgi:hypothetical protein